MNGLDLFTGIGGITIALRELVRPVAYCEIEPYCQSVLLQRMQEGDLPKAPIWDDVSTLQGDELPQIDIITGGFPCQDISVAGAGKGLEGERSGLFFEIVRLSKEIKPKFIFLENVPAITIRGGLRVVREITEMGYDCRWCVISAASVGALHRRERWFLLANSNGTGLEGQRRSASGTKEKISMSSMQSKNACDTDGLSSEQTNSRTVSNTKRGESWRGSSGLYWPFESRDDWQETVSSVCRVSDGVQGQVDRLKALGNAVVPQQVKAAFMHLMKELEDE